MFTFTLDSSITIASGKRAAEDFGTNISFSVKDDYETVWVK